MFYHFLVPGGGGTLHERKNSIEKIPECHPSKLHQQKQRDVISNCAGKIYPSSTYDLFPVVLLLTNHESPYNF